MPFSPLDRREGAVSHLRLYKHVLLSAQFLHFPGFPMTNKPNPSPHTVTKIFHVQSQVIPDSTVPNLHVNNPKLQGPPYSETQPIQPFQQ